MPRPKKLETVLRELEAFRTLNAQLNEQCSKNTAIFAQLSEDLHACEEARSCATHSLAVVRNEADFLKRRTTELLAKCKRLERVIDGLHLIAEQQGTVTGRWPSSRQLHTADASAYRAQSTDAGEHTAKCLAGMDFGEIEKRALAHEAATDDVLKYEQQASRMVRKLPAK